MARPKIYLTPEAAKEAKRLNQQRRTERLGEKLKEYNKNWREENKNILQEKRKLYYIKTKKERIAYNNQYNKKRESEDPNFKFSRHIRKVVYNSFKRSSTSKFRKGSKSEELLGCSLEFLRSYILSKCPEGIALNDFGEKGYHIDHIVPVSSANTQEELEKLCHYTNLQPLWWEDNLKKSNKIYVFELL